MQELERQLLLRLPTTPCDLAEIKQGLRARGLAHDLREIEAIHDSSDLDDVKLAWRIIEEFRSSGSAEAKFPCAQPSVRKFVYIMADALGYYHRHVSRDDAPEGWPMWRGGDFTPGCMVCQARAYEYRKPVGVELSTTPLPLYGRSQRHHMWATMRNKAALAEDTNCPV